jgi:hypothetical protein
MVFEYIFRSRPRRRALPHLAEGVSPTARRRLEGLGYQDEGR